MRPSSLKKREKYLEVATELFLEHGFEGTGLDQLITQCGGSKLTLYNYFGDKRGLLKEVVTGVTETLHQQLVFDADDTTSTEVQLRQFAERYAAFIYHPRFMNLFRLVMERSDQDPELASHFLARGPKYALQVLEQFLSARVDCGELKLDDPQMASEQLLGALRSSRYFEALLTRTPLGKEELNHYADRAVTTFLKGAR
ncbi:TetR/AcrR family transcriptional regulator [Ferrimonas futtsuensis]|uniref:TetR/AcrR family transcriptional regulator n=1 Tax=Ferrimonas futtsuensis TaxID=364764 RepID=UPI00040E9A1C|nr:TetR/AcrR family transcriptional regulator [Ferrimonas futtsuensis]